MNIPIPQFTISREALQTVAAVAKIAKLEELHIVDSEIAQTLDWKKLSPAERPWLLVDLKGLLGPAFTLHAPAPKFQFLAKQLRKSSQSGFVIELKKTYEIVHAKRRFLLPRLPPRVETASPLDTRDAYRVSEDFLLPLAARQSLQRVRNAAGGDVDLLVLENQAKAFALPDDDFVDRYMAVIGIPPHQQGPFDQPERTAELVLRSRSFLSLRVERYPVTCKLMWLPHTKRHWLITEVSIDPVTAVFCEPLRLVREQVRQRRESELDTELAGLTG